MAMTQVYIPASIGDAIAIETFRTRTASLGGAEVARVRRGEHFGSYRVTCDRAALRVLAAEVEALAPATEALARDRGAALAAIARELGAGDRLK